jgi:hypothetical protein
MPKTQIEIERLLLWAFRDELSKRHVSAAEGVWEKIRDYGQRGGVDADPGHGAAQRYAHFGLPHPDAERIERTIGQIQDVVVDWAASLDVLAGPMAGLVSINDFSRRPHGEPAKRTVAGWTDPKTGKWQKKVNQPRDVLLLGTFRAKALVTMHASGGTRPDWSDREPMPHRVQAAKGKNAKIVGECEGRNRYSLGAYCPIEWLPSPVSIIMGRAEYAVWWDAMNWLVANLDLADYVALPPRAPPTPWIENNEAEQSRVVPVMPTGNNYVSAWGTLPLNPIRRILEPLRRATRAAPIAAAGTV